MSLWLWVIILFLNTELPSQLTIIFLLLLINKISPDLQFVVKVTEAVLSTI